MKAKRLDPWERILIQRRRDGVSQREAADACGAKSLYQFRLWESGTEAPPAEVLQNADPRDLKIHERCYLERVRRGISLKALADELGVSRWWLCQMERGRVSSRQLEHRWRRELRPWRGAPVEMARG